MKRFLLFLVLFHVSFLLCAQALGSKKRNLLFMGLDLGKTYTVPYKQPSPFDLWLLEREYSALDRQEWLNFGFFNCAIGLEKFFFLTDMNLALPFYRKVGAFNLQVGIQFGYSFAASRKSIWYLTGGAYYQSLSIDFKNNPPLDFLIVPMPHDQSQLMQDYLILNTQVHFYRSLFGKKEDTQTAGLILGLRFGINWQALESNWRYGYYVGSSKNKSFRGVTRPSMPSTHQSSLYLSLTFGFGIME